MTREFAAGAWDLSWFDPATSTSGSTSGTIGAGTAEFTQIDFFMNESGSLAKIFYDNFDFTTSVPEPSGGLLAVFGSLLIFGSRRFRSSRK